jgi:hypothetical protein
MKKGKTESEPQKSAPNSHAPARDSTLGTLSSDKSGLLRPNPGIKNKETVRLPHLGSSEFTCRAEVLRRRVCG